MKLTTHELKDIAADVHDCRPIGFNKVYALLQHIAELERERGALLRAVGVERIEDDKQ